MMRSSKSVLLYILVSVLMISCLKDSDSEDYSSWKEANEAYFNTMKDSINPETGKPLFTQVHSLAYPQYYVLYRVLSEGPATDTIKPLYTSTVNVDYSLYLYNDEDAQQESNITGVVGTGFIAGWTWALMQMTVGDEAEVIIPWQLAYGATGQNSILPYTTLIYKMKLVKIPYYETGFN